MRDWSFNPDVQIQATVDWIKEYFADNGTPDTKAVIGISGGKDSTIAAALLVRALGNDRVIGVLMPDGDQKDIEDARTVCECLNIEHYTINIKFTTASFIEDIERNSDLMPNGAVYTNMPARVRMITLYNIAAMVGGRVVNTGNWSEGWIGYTTKYGDLAGDFHLFQRLTVREILLMGDAMRELPTHLVHKAPADGMSGKTDADNMGVTYEQIDAYLLEDEMPDAATFHNMNARHKRNLHKRAINLPGPDAKGRKYGDNEFYW